MVVAMWLVYTAMTADVLYIANGRQSPAALVDQLNLLEPDGSGISTRGLVISFSVGFFWTAAVVAGTYFGARSLDVRVLGWIIGAAAGFLAIGSYLNARQPLEKVRTASRSGSDGEMVAHRWRFNSRVVASFHLLAVAGLGRNFWNGCLFWCECTTVAIPSCVGFVDY